MKHRGIVMSRKGMVASAHSLISTSGLKVLNNGGNAIDAIIAMALTSNVVLPDMCNLGGDAFLLYYEAKTNKIYAINGSGGAPQKASLQYFQENGFKNVPKDGMLSVTIPGACDVYFEALDHFGTMTFNNVCQDAIELARNGVPASEKVVRHMHTDYEKMKRFKNLTNIYLKDGHPYEIGELLYNKDYATTLECLCKEGKDAFYKGEIAQKIVNYSHKHGGLIELEDLRDYHCQYVEPISVPYRDYQIIQLPPVSQGIIHLEEMNILNQFDMSKYKNDRASAIHLMVEAKKIAFHDRMKYFGDPDYVTNPVSEILTSEYGNKMANKIKMDRCINEYEELEFDEFSHTTSMVAVDKDGNAVSFIHSISATWGSGEIVDGTGILLNNRAGTGFNLTSGHPNVIAPGKKTMHTLNTYMVTDNRGRLCYVGNTPGGDNQPQWNMQTLCNIIDFGLDVQTALEEPKWADNHTIYEDGTVTHQLKIESQVGEEVLNQLKAMGHDLNVIEPYTCSGASQIIEIREDGLRLGGSDPRADGCAMPEI